MTQPEICANTFLIGAQKAGTTYLAALLDQSADVCVSDPKEPQFFSTGFDRGFADYARCFADPGARIRLDASTTYTFLRPLHAMATPEAPGLLAPVPERILAAAPEAKFIYILRDPVKRAASAYRHNMRSAPPPDGPLSLIACIAQDPMLGLVSRYGDQIERWLDVVPRARFLFLDFRRVTRETEAVLAEVCDFLDIPLTGITLEEAERGKHGAYRETGAGQVMRAAMAAMPGAARAAKAIVPARVKARLLDPVMKAPAEITFHDEEAAAALFEEDRARVTRLTGLVI